MAKALAIGLIHQGLYTLDADPISTRLLGKDLRALIRQVVGICPKGDGNSLPVSHFQAAVLTKQQGLAVAPATSEIPSHPCGGDLPA